MPQRWYLPPSSGATGISPSAAAEWDDTAGIARVVPSLTKTNQAFATQSLTFATATANLDSLFKQYVYKLPYGTVFATTDTIKGRVLVSENASASNLRSQAIVRVIASDGTTVRTTLYAGDTTTGTSNPTSEWNLTTLRNIQMPRGTTVAVAANYTSAINDYLVIELGYRKHAAASTTGNMRFGDNNATDLPEDETTTADNNTWIELSFGTAFPAAAAASTATGDVIKSVDAFGGTTGDALTTYNAGWVAVDGARTAVITAAARARGNSSSITAYTWSTNPTSADHDVRGDVVVRSALGTNAYMMLAARQSGTLGGSTYNGYSAGFTSTANSWVIMRWDNGTATQLASYGGTATIDASYPVEFRCRDASKKLIIDGVERASSSDNTYTSAGATGFVTYGGGSTPSDTTGIHLDNFAAQDVMTAASPPSYSGWSPISMGLAGWYKPHEMTGLVDGDPVSTLPDVSGNSRNMTASTTLRPLYKKQIQNNRGVLRFDGSNDKMTASVAAATFPTSFHWTGVFRKTGSAATFEASPILRTSGNLGVGYDRYNTSLFTGSGEFSTTTTSIASMTSWTLLSSGDSTTTRVEWRNGTNELNVSGVTSYSDTGTLIQLGERDDNATIFAGDVGEIIIWPSAPSTADRQLVEGYLAWTWNLVASLDVTHPYKTEAPSDALHFVNRSPVQHTVYRM